MANYSRKNYDIKRVTYTKHPTGKVDERGRKIYETVGEPKTTTMKNTNWSRLKQDIYDKSKNDKNVFVNYDKPKYTINKQPRKLKNVVKVFANGDREVTYYNSKKK